ISHAINHQTGKDIENAIQDIRRTSVAQLVPNRDRGNESNTLPGNSNWFEWQWPTSGDFEGCILARSIPNLGPWTTFTPT
ncbi:1221_t:CDS:2, partial [Rhizophagus irregularis]